MKKRIQISTNVSIETQKQARELMAKFGYSMRDVVTVAIDRLYREIAPPVERAQKSEKENG